LRGGEIRTQFFHREASSNRRKNNIDSLLVNRSLSSNSTEIRNHIVQLIVLYATVFRTVKLEAKDEWTLFSSYW